MTKKPCAVFDTSAWLAYFNGEAAELEHLVETHEILTPQLCLLELADFYSNTIPDSELRARLKFVSLLHTVPATTPETAAAMSDLAQSILASEREVLVLAAEEGVPAYFCMDGVLRVVEPKALPQD